jgi:hypothetical protein
VSQGLAINGTVYRHQQLAAVVRRLQQAGLTVEQFAHPARPAQPHREFQGAHAVRLRLQRRLLGAGQDPQSPWLALLAAITDAHTHHNLPLPHLPTLEIIR